MSQLFDKKESFQQRKSNATIEPQDAAAIQKHTPRIDISTLSDKERAHYVLYGKLPPVDENSNSELASMAQRADEALADFKPSETLEKQQKNINRTNDGVSDSEILSSNPFASTDNDSDIVTNWDAVHITHPELFNAPSSTASTTETTQTTDTSSTDTINKHITDTPVNQPTNILIHPVSIDADVELPDPEPYVITTKIVKHTDTPDDTPQSTAIDETTITNELKNDTSTKPVDTTSMDDSYTVTSEDTTDTTNTTDYGIIAPDENYKNVYNNLRDSINKLANKFDLNDSIAAEEYNNILTNPNGSYYKQNALSDVATASRDFDQASLNALGDLQTLQDTTPINFKPKNSSPKIDTSGLKSEDKIVKGKQAKMLVLAKLRGTKRVPLANSGFYVDVRPLTNLELSEYINTIYTENSEYGRNLGGHFYLYASLYIKKFFAERLTKIVVGSNLQGWTQGTTLQDNLSLQDFRTLMWACADLMFKDGVEFTKICAFCQHVEKVTMNLSKLYFVNHPAMTRALEYISQKKTVSQEDCAEYRARLEFGISNSYKWNEWLVNLKIPSLTDYLIYANMFSDDLHAHVENVGNTSEVHQYVRSTHFKQYAPWIKDISSMNEDGTIGFKLAYMEDIFDNIDSIFEDSTEFVKYMEQYIQKTMLSYIAFPYVACPNCGKVPTNIQNGFVAYDIESAFFTMSVRKSQEISSRLQDSTAI